MCIALHKFCVSTAAGVSEVCGADGAAACVCCAFFVLQTLKYLSVVYKLEWANFVERLLSSPAIQDHIVKVQQQKLPTAPDVTHDSFAKGAHLSPAVAVYPPPISLCHCCS